jgi:hypothetical protein
VSSEVVDVLTGEVLSGDLIHELDESEARALTDRIVHSTTLAAQLVAEAWQGRAWKALGYKSWESYADAELPMLGSNSSNRHVLLVGLRNVGMSTRAISAVTGLGVGTVHRHTSGVPDGTPDRASTTGTDGKQYPSKVRRTKRLSSWGMPPQFRKMADHPRDLGRRHRGRRTTTRKVSVHPLRGHPRRMTVTAPRTAQTSPTRPAGRVLPQPPRRPTPDRYCTDR